MTYFYRTLFILLLLFNFKFYLKIFIYYFKTKRLSKEYINTQNEVDKLGVNVAIIGLPRSGKNVLANGLLYSKEQHLMQKAKDMLEEIKICLYFLDFDLVDLIIEDYKRKKNNTVSYVDFKYIVGKIFHKFKINDGIFNNYIQNNKLSDLINNYVICYYTLYIRGFNVLSYTYQYSFVSHTVARILMDDTFNLKEVVDNGIFYLEPFMLTFSDERSLTKSNLLSTSRKEKDKGGKEFACLVGNMFQETLFNLSLKQISSDEIANERRLKTDNLYIMGKGEIKNSFYNLTFEVDKMIQKLNKRYIKRFKRKSYNDEFKAKYISFKSWTNDLLVCDYKKEFMQLHLLKKYITTLGYIKTKVRNYYKEEDVGSANVNSYYDMEFTYPIWCSWGANDTHEFKLVLDELYKHSKVKAMNVPKNSMFKTYEVKSSMVSFLYKRSEENEK